MARYSPQRRAIGRRSFSTGRDTGRLLILRSLILALLLVLSGLLARGQNSNKLLADKTRILFVLDASSSMLKDFNSSTSKMDVAKSILADLTDSLKNHPKLEIGLRVYGHHYKPSVTGCEDTNLEVEFSPNNHGEIIEKLESIVPKGGTPLAYSLSQTVNDFPKDDPSYNVIILITDGAESCKGDPCQVSRELQKQGIFLQPYIIGLDMDGRYSSMFDCMGSYFNAKDSKSFKSALVESINKTLYRPTVSIELLDSEGRSHQTDLAVTLFNKTTGEAKYQLIHYFKSGYTDTLSLSPDHDYDVEISSLPPVRRNNFSFKENGHTALKIPVPRGTLNLSMRSTTYYKKPVTAIVKRASDGAYVFSQLPNSSQKYLQGTYDVEVLTRPSTLYTGISIKGEEELNLTIQEPGILQTRNRVPGFASIFKKEGNELKWVENFEFEKSTGSVTLQPGKYQISFRAKNAKGSKFTVTKEFEILPRQITNITIYNP